MLKFFEGFDLWTGAITGAGKGWVYRSGTIDVGAGRFGGQAIGFNGGYAYSLALELIETAQQSLAAGMAYYFDDYTTWYTSPCDLFVFCTGSTPTPTTSCGVRWVNGSGYKFEYSDTAGNTTPITGFVTPSNDTWTYLEVGLQLDEIGGTTGLLTMRQDGNVIFSASVINTVTQIDFLSIVSPGSEGYQNQCDDFYYYTGGGVDSGIFIGPLMVQTKSPTADAYNDGSWISSTSALYNAVNGSNVGTINGTITSSGAGGEFLLDIGTLTGALGSILGVQPCYLAISGSAVDTAVGTVKSGAESASCTVMASVNTTLTLFGAGAIEKDPATDARWTADAVNAASYGVTKG